MKGKTSWWPCDSTEHDRDANVALGLEFGSGGPLVMRVLKDLAQQQRVADDDAGEVLTGFNVLRHKCFLSDADEARRIVERAAELEALDDLVIRDSGQRFTCRISGWTEDSVRGREALKKANQRAKKKEEADAGGHVPPEGDKSPQDKTQGDQSPIAVTEQEQEPSSSGEVHSLHPSPSSSSVTGAEARVA